MSPDTHPLIRKLETIFSLSDDEKAAVVGLPIQAADLRADQDIVREGDRPSRCCLILSGFACAYKITGEGKRQIMAFYMIGDIPDLQSIHLQVLDNGIATISPAKVGFIQHEALRELCERCPRITSAFWRETLIDAAVFREWVMNVGRRDATSRMAHILCELVVRQRALGLIQGHSCDLPITQREFGDALGLSTVHVNRVVQELRRRGLIVLRGTSITIQGWDGLKRVGDFQPTYLHLSEAESAAA